MVRAWLEVEAEALLEISEPKAWAIGHFAIQQSSCLLQIVL